MLTKVLENFLHANVKNLKDGSLIFYFSQWEIDTYWQPSRASADRFFVVERYMVSI